MGFLTRSLSFLIDHFHNIVVPQILTIHSATAQYIGKEFLFLSKRQVKIIEEVVLYNRSFVYKRIIIYIQKSDSYLMSTRILPPF